MAEQSQQEQEVNSAQFSAVPLASVQQVNLLPPELMPKQVLLSARQSLLLAGVFFLGMLMITLLSQQSLSDLKQQEENTRQQLTTLEQQLQQLQQLIRSTDSKALDRKLVTMEERLDRRRELQQALAGRQMDEGQSFSRLLTGLSKHHVNGISLDRFRLQQSGHIDMAGEVREAQLVPRYLKALREDIAFQSTRFGPLLLERKDNARYLEFAVGDVQGAASDD
ncbi:MAG: hypothetical protein K6L73_04430 [Cellvibrionaceae bacterium]